MHAHILSIRHLAKVDGGFTLWATWSSCSVTCGDGTRSRSRTCTNPEPQHGGLDCVGDTIETDVCNDAACPSKQYDMNYFYKGHFKLENKAMLNVYQL